MGWDWMRSERGSRSEVNGDRASRRSTQHTANRVAAEWREEAKTNGAYEAERSEAKTSRAAQRGVAWRSGAELGVVMSASGASGERYYFYWFTF